MLRHRLIHPIIFSHLNETQKNIIDGTIKFAIDEIVANLNPIEISEAFNFIATGKNRPAFIVRMNKKDIFQSMMFIRDILTHPCPQNRKVGDPNVAEFLLQSPDFPSGPEDVSQVKDGVIDGTVYYAGTDGRIRGEKQGMLGLTSRNDNTALPVNREVVVDYVRLLLSEANKEYSEKAILVSNYRRSGLAFDLIISKEDWVVSYGKNHDKNDTYGICLEGVYENGQVFLERYSLHTTLEDRSISIAVENISNPQMFFQRGHNNNFQISSVQGQTLKNLIKDEVYKSMSRIEHCTNTTFLYFFKRDHYSKQWCLNMLKQISVNLKLSEPPLRLPFLEQDEADEIINNYRKFHN